MPTIRKRKPPKTALLNAVKKNDLAEVRLILEAGSDPNAADKRGGGWTPLHWACWYGFTEIVRSLLKHGAGIEDKTVFGWTPLYFACRSNATEIVKLLLSHDADPNPKDSFHERSILCEICEHIHPPRSGIARILLQAGASMTEDEARRFLDVTVCLPAINPDRELLLEWYREHHPEMFMERFCTENVPPGM